MTRALIEAGIVWYEGVPENTADDIDHWHELSRQTGDSVSSILMQFVAFKKQDSMSVYLPYILSLEELMANDKKE